MINDKIISETTHQQACEYIRSQFGAHSWWPKAQPGLAEQEFNLMCGSAGALNVWCEKWLDPGQIGKLEKAISK